MPGNAMNRIIFPSFAVLCLSSTPTFSLDHDSYRAQASINHCDSMQRATMYGSKINPSEPCYDFGDDKLYNKYIDYCLGTNQMGAPGCKESNFARWDHNYFRSDVHLRYVYCLGFGQSWRLPVVPEFHLSLWYLLDISGLIFSRYRYIEVIGKHFIQLNLQAFHWGIQNIPPFFWTYFPCGLENWQRGQ